MKLSDFSKAKVGDRAWSFSYGWGCIVNINTALSVIRALPDDVCKDDDINDYDINGRLDPLDKLSDLYWDEIKFEVPEMPKRMIKLKKWIGVYKQSNEEIIYSTSHFMYETEEDAKRYCAGANKHIPIEFEVEE